MPGEPTTASLRLAIDALLDASAMLATTAVEDLSDADRCAWGWAAARRARVAADIVEDLLTSLDRTRQGRAPLRATGSAHPAATVRRLREGLPGAGEQARPAMDRHHADLERWESELRGRLGR